jgi:Clp amino terminal domain, pathogenicity island component
MSGSAPIGPVPFTPRAKKVLELSLREALQMGHRYIGTEHLLLGLVREGEGVAATVLVSFGAELPRVRQEVIKLISGGQEPYGGGQVNELDTATDRSTATLEPRCPRCRAGVTDGTRFRTIAVHPDVQDANPISIDVVYCVQFGTTLHMFKTEGRT